MYEFLSNPTVLAVLVGIALLFVLAYRVSGTPGITKEALIPPVSEAQRICEAIAGSITPVPTFTLESSQMEDGRWKLVVARASNFLPLVAVVHETFDPTEESIYLTVGRNVIGSYPSTEAGIQAATRHIERHMRRSVSVPPD